MTHIIDGGSWIGDSIQNLKSYAKSSDVVTVHAFEPHPDTVKLIPKNKNIIIYNTALWITDGIIDLYDHNGKSKQGTSLMKDKGNVGLNTFKVQCIDTDKWIKNTFNKDDYLILKLDIEGAEYQVIDNMITNGSISYINKLFVEWHYKKIPSISEKTHSDILKRLPLKAQYWT